MGAILPPSAISLKNRNKIKILITDSDSANFFRGGCFWKFFDWTLQKNQKIVFVLQPIQYSPKGGQIKSAFYRKGKGRSPLSNCLLGVVPRSRGGNFAGVWAASPHWHYGFGGWSGLGVWVPLEPSLLQRCE